MDKQGPISESELLQSLINSKKIMTKVDGGDFKTGYIDNDILTSDPMDLLNNEHIASKRPSGTPSINKINESRLPDNIKQAMINNPIQQPDAINLSDGLDIKLVQKAKRLMEQESPKSNSNNRQNNSNTNNSFKNDNSDIIRQLTPIIENVIRKTLDDIIDKKLSQILTAQQTATINENLVLKVGNTIFKGKITGSKTI